MPEVNWALMRRVPRRSCSRFELVERARRGVRHRGDGHDGITSCSSSWSRAAALGLALLAAALARRRSFLVVDLAFFGANVVKIAHGGWLPLAIGVGHLHADDDVEARPARCSASALRARRCRSSLFLAGRRRPRSRSRVPGTAVFMTSQPDGAPPALLHHFKHNKVLHEQVMLLSIVDRARARRRRATSASSVERPRPGLLPACRARYGFMETPERARGPAPAAAPTRASRSSRTTRASSSAARRCRDGHSAGMARGGSSCSRSCRATRGRRRRSSVCRRTASSSSGCRSSSDALARASRSLSRTLPLALPLPPAPALAPSSSPLSAPALAPPLALKAVGSRACGSSS